MKLNGNAVKLSYVCIWKVRRHGSVHLVIWEIAHLLTCVLKVHIILLSIYAVVLIY